MLLRSEQTNQHHIKPGGLLSAANLQYKCHSGHAEGATQESHSDHVSPEDTTRYVFSEIWNKKQHFKHFCNLSILLFWVFLHFKLLSISRGQNSLNHESELHPTSIVINVTTNIKPCSQKQDNIMQEGQKGFTTEEVLCLSFLIF